MKLSFLLVGLSMVVASISSADPIVEDSFESGDITYTSAGGFRWVNPNFTSVVTEDRVVWGHGSDNPQAPAGSSWKARSGGHALRFYYLANKWMSEQRFELGQGHDEVWLSYWLRVPVNYYHSTNINKFFALWMDGYSQEGQGSTAWWGMWADGKGGSTLAFTWSDGNNSTSNAYQQYKSFISYPQDQGRWMHVVMRVKAETSSGAKNGEMEFWRRWENERDFTQLHQGQGLPLRKPNGGPNGWAAGYLLGWANSSYREDTIWLLDDFKVYTERPKMFAKIVMPKPKATVVK